MTFLRKDVIERRRRLNAGDEFKLNGILTLSEAVGLF
jgi:hypothetical protein